MLRPGRTYKTVFFVPGQKPGQKSDQTTGQTPGEQPGQKSDRTTSQTSGQIPGKKIEVGGYFGRFLMGNGWMDEAWRPTAHGRAYCLGRLLSLPAFLAQT